MAALKNTLPKGQKILLVATEASPYASVGGVAQVMNYLSRALSSMGCEVAVFIPKFGSIEEKKHHLTLLHEGLEVPTGDEATPYLRCNVKTTKNDGGVIYYFLENQEYYEKRANVYGYTDDPTRWGLLSKGVIEFLKFDYFAPDIIHCNDWQTGMVPNLLKTEYKDDPKLGNITTVFTVHNIAFQGMFDHHHVSEMDYDDGKSEVAPFFSKRLTTQNFMKRGIIYADAVNTVSKSYAKEILTPEFGEGLDRLLLELKGKLFGIINGIDYDLFDPSTDTLIEKTYDINDLTARKANKRAVQKEYDLDIDPEIFMLGFVGRLDGMKGVDLLIKTLKYFLREFNVQFVQVGGGDGGLADMLQSLKKEFPKRVGLHPFPNFSLPHLLFAGTDCIVYPSRFEPCGIVQIEAMRYGSIPIVRKVGGLADTVTDYDPITGIGTGFVFKDFDEFALYGQLVRAHEAYFNKEVWKKLQKNAMEADFSWKYSASEYLKLYSKAALLKKEITPREKVY